MGSSDDARVLFDREVVAAMPGIHEMDPQVFDIDVRAGQFPVEVYHAHRGSPSAGLRGDRGGCGDLFGGGVIGWRTFGALLLLPRGA